MGNEVLAASGTVVMPARFYARMRTELARLRWFHNHARPLLAAVFALGFLCGLLFSAMKEFWP